MTKLADLDACTIQMHAKYCFEVSISSQIPISQEAYSFAASCQEACASGTGKVFKKEEEEKRCRSMHLTEPLGGKLGI